MRMRDGDCLDAAKAAKEGFGRIIEQRDAVPENIACGVRNSSARWPIANSGWV